MQQIPAKKDALLWERPLDTNLKQFIISHDFIYPKKGMNLFYQLAFNIRSSPIVEYAYDSYI